MLVKFRMTDQLKKIEEQMRAYEQSHACEFVHFYKWQKEAIKGVHKFQISVIPAPNKIGKSCLLVNIALSWALGYEPWTFSETEFPGSIYVRHKKGYYNPSSLGKPPPVKIRITGEDWRKHLGEAIVPELKKWAPAGEYETTKNDFSIEDKWNFKNGSTFELMTYSQKLELFESWTGDGWIPDEPPMKEVYDAMGRGIFLNGGKIVMMMTPIKEPWIWDEFVEPENPRTDVFLMKDLSVLDNETVYKEDDETLMVNAGLS